MKEDPQITLTQFKRQLKQELAKFSTQYANEAVEDPDTFPKKMRASEWDAQLKTWQAVNRVWDVE